MTSRTRTTPPYTITATVLDLAERIGEAIGRAEEAAVRANLRLRRVNRIRTIQGSLAIEGNTLTEEQISTILEGKPVLAPLREIQEVRNAIKAYEQFPQWNPASEADLLNAHEVLMAGLLDAPGRYRRGGVAVTGAGEVQHIGPPAGRVPHLMSNLLSWLGGTEEHSLIASSVFHYEFEFIHPFEDGNGRMGRLWQTLILTRWKPLFADVPVESLVHARQGEYYDAIRESTAKGESTPFVVFLLEAILEAVRDVNTTDQAGDQVTDQVARLIAKLRDGPKSAVELMAALGLSHRPTFRNNYIRPALSAGLVEMTRPDSPTARNQKYRLTPSGRTVGQIQEDLQEPRT